MTISHREMIGYIKRSPGSQEFSSLAFYCQPGSYLQFPWLSAIALRFETYSFTKLVYHVSSRLPSIEPGTIGACFDHDPLDPSPSTMVQAMGMRDHYATSAWSSWSFPIDLSKSHRPFYYTRPSDILPGDRKTYDTGKVTFFTEGLATDATAAIIEVEYTVQLFTPQLDDAEGTAGTARSTTGITSTNLLGTDFTPLAAAEKLIPVRAYPTDPTAFEFIKPFEGLMNMTVMGADFTSGLGTTVVAKGVNSDPSAPNPSWSALHDIWNTFSKSRSQKIRVSAGDIIKMVSTGGSSSFTGMDVDFGQGRFSALE